MPSTAQQLDRRILAFIDSRDAERFDELALDLFDYQFSNNRVYRRYCEQTIGRRRPGSWDDIPAVWPVAWRLAELTCFPPDHARAEFISSGTTGGGRSRHLFDTLDLYEAAFARPFASAMLTRESVPILVLMASPDEEPTSSLSFMMGRAIARFGCPADSGFFIRQGKLLADEFARAVAGLSARAQPMALASTAFGWVMFLDWLAGRSLPLPPGSRVMETGGYKGRVTALPRDTLYRRLGQAFAIPPDAIISEYGMCELSSQFYSTGETIARFTGPHWTRILSVDPESQRPVPPGEPGLLRIIDLANRGSVIAVQTEDLAVATGERSFVLIGRAPSAPAKGCSLIAEDAWRL